MSQWVGQIKSFAQKRNLPVIPVSAQDISFINDPNAFYQTLLKYISSSDKRISLSALYFGTGSKEDAIVRALLANLSRKNDLDINITLDANRATRTDKQGSSSVSMLDKLLTKGHVKLNLVESYKGKSLIQLLFRNYPRYNEIYSTYHSKMLVFDNDLILTGANLSSIYFEKRQDRYLVVKDSSMIADYVCELSHNLVIHKSHTYQRIYELNNRYIQSYANEKLGDSFIIPLIQHGPSGLKDGDDMIMFLDSILPNSSKVYMSSGYFNPSKDISKLHCDVVIAPSEEANGFFDGGGILNFIPRTYLSIYKQFKRDHPSCKFFLYNRPGWSFHAKGYWADINDDLCVHMVGSSNFNHRSSNRDFETQFLIVTRNKSLIEKMRAERNSLLAQSSLVSQQELSSNGLIYDFLARVFKTFL